MLLATSLYSKNIQNSVQDIHTLTNKENTLELTLTYLKMDDTIDVLDIKGKEFSSSSIGSIGDLTGYEIKTKYSFTDKLQLNFTRVNQNIEYTGGDITNNRNDIFLRYNLIQKNSALLNNGLSIDVGYVTNTLDNYFLTDLTSINDMINRIEKDQNTDNLEIINPTNTNTYVLVNHTQSDTKILTEKPYISLEDTSDKSFYLRLLTGFHTKKTMFDFYIGYKKTKIENTISSTKELQNLVNNNSNLTLPLNLNRNEYMLFTGFNISRDIGKFITEFNYEYERFFRDEGLDYINFNHVINASIARPITKKLLVFIGAKIMYRQFNGQIPYLYNKYSQTTYDHKYGYAKIGLQYKFNF